MNGAERAGASGAVSGDVHSVLPEGGSLGWNRVGRWIAATVVRLPFRMRIHRRDRIPRSGPVVLVANHSSLVEGPLLFGMVPYSSVFLVKHELFRGPLGWFLRKIGQIPVRRGEPDRRPLLAAVRVLRAGGLVAVFPEGTRGTGDVKTAQDGAAWLARTSGARVLPVVCRGTYRPPGRRRRFLPRVDVMFGEPVTLTGAKGRAGLTRATEQIRDELVALVTELDRTIGGGRDDEARGKQA